MRSISKWKHQPQGLHYREAFITTANRKAFNPQPQGFHYRNSSVALVQTEAKCSFRLRRARKLSYSSRWCLLEGLWQFIHFFLTKKKIPTINIKGSSPNQPRSTPDKYQRVKPKQQPRSTSRRQQLGRNITPSRHTSKWTEAFIIKIYRNQTRREPTPDKCIDSFHGLGMGGKTSPSRTKNNSFLPTAAEKRCEKLPAPHALRTPILSQAGQQ